MTKTFEFDSRTTWLAYRADWRLRYAEASSDIRARKRDMQADVLARRTADSETTAAIDRRTPDQQSELHYERVKANALMVELGKAKEQRDRLIAERDAPESLAA